VLCLRYSILERNRTLVILPLGDFELTKANIWQHSKVISNIGEKLEPKYKQALTTNAAQEALVAPSQFVEIHIDQNELRYRIKSELWIDGVSLYAFMKQTFIKPGAVAETLKELHSSQVNLFVKRFIVK